MGLFRALEELAKTPFDVVADVVTLGGSLTDKSEPYTARRAKRIMKTLDQ